MNNSSDIGVGPRVDLGRKNEHLDRSTNSSLTPHLMGQEVQECNFVTGLQTLKPQGINKNKTMKGPIQRKSKAGRNLEGKENHARGARGQMHGEEKKEVTMMEVEANGVGAKRKERLPLEEIPVNDETVSEMTLIKRKLDRQQGLVVPSIRRGGGLALLWKSSTKVDVQTFSPRHIDAIVTEEQSKKQWRFMGFYGHPETNKRMDSWRFLEELSTRSTLP
nr:hypothetical protein CFP56_32795 [Quercus suber]